MQNFERSDTGMVRAVCRGCGAVSCWVQPDYDGQPDIFDISPWGWSSAPYVSSFRHGDGSYGSFFHCPVCNEKRFKKS